MHPIALLRNATHRVHPALNAPAAGRRNHRPQTGEYQKGVHRPQWRSVTHIAGWQRSARILGRAEHVCAPATCAHPAMHAWICRAHRSLAKLVCAIISYILTTWLEATNCCLLLPLISPSDLPLGCLTDQHRAVGRRRCSMRGYQADCCKDGEAHSMLGHGRLNIAQLPDRGSAVSNCRSAAWSCHRYGSS